MGYSDCEDFVINCTDRRFEEIGLIYRQVAVDLKHDSCRYQIGSYTCGNYFFGLLRWLRDHPDSRPEKGYDLVIPIFSETQLEKFERYEKAPIFQFAKYIVVNDYGMLRRLAGKYRVRLGRMLFQDYRDHRYPEYESEPNYQFKSDVVLDMLQKMGYRDLAMENDLITEYYSDVLAGTCVYYHIPYRQISSAHICEFAALGKPAEKKFVPNDSCEFQCFKVRIRQTIESQHVEYWKIGRSVFDIIPKGWQDSLVGSRLIYTPRW